MDNEQGKQQAETKESWHRPELTEISVARTEFEVGPGLDGMQGASVGMSAF